MLEDKLLDIGLSGKEAKIYLELLSIGPQAVSVLAARMEFPRTTTYSILKTLLKKGLVSYCLKNDLKYFSANDPNCLLGYVEMQKRSFDYLRSCVEVEIPKLRSLRRETEFRQPLVRYYEGRRGVRRVMEDALTAESEVCSYFALHKWQLSRMKDFLISFWRNDVMKKKMQMKIISPKDEKIGAYFNRYEDLFPEALNILYIDHEAANDLLQQQVNIYDGKLGIVHLVPGEEFGVLMESKQVAQMQKRIFDLAWRGCEAVMKLM